MRRQDGFTLIELLVVILIIGILAAIAIPAFLGQRLRAADAEAKSSLVTAHKALESFKLDNHGSYAGATPAALITIEPTLADAPGLSIPLLDPTGFALQVNSRASGGGGGPFFLARDATGATYRACLQPRRGGCGPVKVIPGYGPVGSW